MNDLIKYLLLLIIISPTCLKAQETKKVISKGRNYIEVYTVLSANEKIKHGSYRLKTRKGVLLVEGYYKNDVQDSCWVKYYSKDKPAEKGSYHNGAPTGIWEFYNDTTLFQKYDYNTKQMLYYLPEKKETGKKYTVLQDTGFAHVVLDQPPLYIGGERKIASFVGNNLVYPANAFENRISGQVLVTFIIDKNGSAANYGIKKSVSKDCDAEALRVVQLLPPNWVPAVLNGKPADVIYIMPISFSIN